MFVSTKTPYARGIKVDNPKMPAQTGDVPNREVTGERVRALLESDGFNPDQVKIADWCYTVPTEEAVVKFGKRFGSFLQTAGLESWMSELWDCDDFAFAAKTFSAIDNAVWRKQTGSECALGFGIAAVVSGGLPHVMNVGLGLNNKGEVELRYFEPQMKAAQSIGEPNVWLERKSRDSFTLALWCYF